MIWKCVPYPLQTFRWSGVCSSVLKKQCYSSTDYSTDWSEQSSTWWKLLMQCSSSCAPSLLCWISRLKKFEVKFRIVRNLTGLFGENRCVTIQLCFKFHYSPARCFLFVVTAKHWFQSECFIHLFYWWLKLKLHCVHNY